MVGSGVAVRAGFQHDFDGCQVAGECFLVEEGPAVLVLPGDQARISGELLLELRRHPRGHRMLVACDGRRLAKGNSEDLLLRWLLLDADVIRVAEGEAPHLVVLSTRRRAHPRAN